MSALQIVFHQLQPSAVVEAKVRQRFKALERLRAGITSCRVTIEQQNRHRHKGNLFSVRIVLNVPGKEIVVSQSPDADPAHEDPYVALRDAFDCVRRQLEEHLRRNDTKRHALRMAEPINKLAI